MNNNFPFNRHPYNCNMSTDRLQNIQTPQQWKATPLNDEYITKKDKIIGPGNGAYDNM